MDRASCRMATKNREENRAVASLTVPGGQEFHFPNFSSNFDQFILFFLKLYSFSSSVWFSGWAARPRTREGPGYATGREGGEDRKEDGETTLLPTFAQPGQGQIKTEEDSNYLRRATSDSGWYSHEWVRELLLLVFFFFFFFFNIRWYWICMIDSKNSLQIFE